MAINFASPFLYGLVAGAVVLAAGLMAKFKSKIPLKFVKSQKDKTLVFVGAILLIAGVAGYWNISNFAGMTGLQAGAMVGSLSATGVPVGTPGALGAAEPSAVAGTQYSIQVSTIKVGLRVQNSLSKSTASYLAPTLYYRTDGNDLSSLTAYSDGIYANVSVYPSVVVEFVTDSASTIPGIHKVLVQAKPTDLLQTEYVEKQSELKARFWDELKTTNTGQDNDWRQLQNSTVQSANLSETETTTLAAGQSFKYYAELQVNTTVDTNTIFGSSEAKRPESNLYVCVDYNTTAFDIPYGAVDGATLSFADPSDTFPSGTGVTCLSAYEKCAKMPISWIGRTSRWLYLGFDALSGVTPYDNNGPQYAIVKLGQKKSVTSSTVDSYVGLGTAGVEGTSPGSACDDAAAQSAINTLQKWNTCIGTGC